MVNFKVKFVEGIENEGAILREADLQCSLVIEGKYILVSSTYYTVHNCQWFFFDDFSAITSK